MISSAASTKSRYVVLVASNMTSTIKPLTEPGSLPPEILCAQPRLSASACCVFVMKFTTSSAVLRSVRMPAISPGVKNPTSDPKFGPVDATVAAPCVRVVRWHVREPSPVGYGLITICTPRLTNGSVGTNKRVHVSSAHRNSA